MQAQIIRYQELHQNECFICNKGGYVQMCDICPRVYHPMCEQLKMNQQKNFYCETDSAYRQCEFCQRIPATTDETVKCTICYKNAHVECYWHPLYIIKKDKQSEKIEEEKIQLIYNQKSYVCKECLLRNGIRSIARTEKISKSKNFVVQQFIIGLVHINHRSPIHYGWFSQEEIRKAFAKQRQNPYFNKRRQARLIENRIVETKPIIEKILIMRIPITQNQEIKDEQILSMLRDSERAKNLRFGDRGNFKFLVKWIKNEYYLATWQDELTVRLLDKDNKLQQFIQRHQQMYSSDLDLIFKTDKTRYNKYLSQLSERKSNNDTRHLQLQNYKEIYTVNIAINDRNGKDIRDIVEYLKSYYCVKRQSSVTLVIVPKQKIKRWEEELIRAGDQLRYLIFSGNQRSIELIKAVEFVNNNKKYDFQVLVLQYENYRQHRSFLQAKIDYIHQIILTNFSQPTFLEDLYSIKKKEQGKKLKSRLMFVVNRVVNNKSWEEEIIRKICLYLQKNTILKHTLSWSEIELVSCDKAKNSYTQNGVHFNNSHTDSNFKKEPFSQEQRIIFLNYTLRFGFIPTNANALYDRIYSSDECKELFTNAHQSKSSFRKYVKAFYHLLIVHQQMNIAQDTLNYYLFGCDPIQIRKRIVQLYKLRCLLDNQFYQFNIKPPLIRSTTGDVIGQISSWTNRNDYVLAQLIISQGFGNWKQMMQNTTYVQYCQKKPEGKTPYSFYLKVLLILFGKNKIQPIELIESRATAILQRMSEI